MRSKAKLPVRRGFDRTLRCAMNAARALPSASVSVHLCLVDKACEGMNSDASAQSGQQWITERELSAHLKVSIRHLVNLRRRGLPHILLGSAVRYDLAEVTAYLKTNRRLSAHVERQRRRAAITGPAA